VNSSFTRLTSAFMSTERDRARSSGPIM
jgi:hypothetical protein